VGERRRQRGADVGLLVEGLRRTAEGSESVHPAISGLTVALLYLGGLLSEDELAGALRLRLSPAEEPLRAARFVEGLFSLNRAVLVRNRAIVDGLTGFLVGLPSERFVGILPVLRRSLAGLTPSELGYLVETIAAGLGLEAEEPGAPAIEASQLDELAALDEELGDLSK
jgi:hypothetical protein